MGVRKIVKIDEEKCDGCGLCVPSCAEGAIQIVDGKAKLVSEIYCDGLGACLGDCPLDAITVEEREAADFDEAAVETHLEKIKDAPSADPLPIIATDDPPSMPSAPAGGGCPGSAMRQFGQTEEAPKQGLNQPVMPSQLGHWPIQLKLVPPQAPFLKNADLLICADCVPFTVPDFHYRYLTGRAVLIGCPKLDDLQHYYEKMRDIFTQAQPRSITVLKMEVPCCDGIAQAAVQACREVAPEIPLNVQTIGIKGGVLSDMTPPKQTA
jgi:Pyruvate/2-oxoacid:ferredoxin oxidoreductase delta subunit